MRGRWAWARSRSRAKRNQPLLAEIPIVSTTPGELAALQARLASPETFRRVGLAPPSGVAADLQFSLGSDAKGRPVIRVTTIRPIEQPVLSFLIEVDWGAGRLVREYSALMDARNTAGAVLPPEVSTPQTPLPPLVQRPEPVVASTPPARAPAAAANPPPPAPASVPAPARMQAEAPAPSNALPASQPVRPAPLAVARSPRSRTRSDPMRYGPIKPGESLSKIASGLDLRRSFSLDQTMLALLQANPDAFLGDDINRLTQWCGAAGAHARTWQRIRRRGEAAQVVRQQARPVGGRLRSSPVRAAGRLAAVQRRREPAALRTRSPRGRNPRRWRPSRPRRPHRGGRRRACEIVPPTAPGKATGNKSGTSAGGEGSMLQQELRQRDEDIAAKSAEIGELKERLAALEKLKDEQQKLLSLKDSELAAAQARLAASNQAAQAKAAAPPPRPPPSRPHTAEVADRVR